MGIQSGILLLMIFTIVRIPPTLASVTDELKPGEPVCLSRFDHDYKVIQKLAMLEIEQKELRETIAIQNTMIDGLSKELSGVSRPAVAFSAQVTTDLVKLPQGTTIVFDHVILNVGNAYDPQHGVFTAMHAGIYYFSTTLSAPTSSQLWIMKNGVSYEYTFAPESTWNTGTAAVTLQLVKGDRVWVEGNKMAAGFNNWPSGGRKCHHTGFTGFLISII